VRANFGTDLAPINPILHDIQYFRAWSGDLPEFVESRQVASEHTMCQHVVQNERPLVVENFLETEEFKNQYFCLNYGVQIYAVTPLPTSEGVPIGMLCVAGGEPREFGEEEPTLLGAFSQGRGGPSRVARGARARTPE
jgi:GAF domain-containing protein